MKTIIFLTLIVAFALASPEDCVKEKCGTEYNACVKEVFGCAAVGLKCKNKCGDSDDACYSKCAYDSGNQKMINLYECGKRECPAATMTLGCDVQGCTQLFTTECVSTDFKNTISCSLSFFERYPECDCVKDF